jgi:hypothetical protein
VADRYCRNCGQALRPEARFCTGCGRAVYETAHVPTPEAVVSVPPPPQPAADSPEAAESATLPAPPASAQQQQRPAGFWQQYKWPILWLLGSLVFAGLWTAYVDAPPGAFVGFALVYMLRRIVVFCPMWLFLGGGFYLCARLLGEKPAFLRVIFNRWLTIFIGILVLLSGVFTYLD